MASPSLIHRASIDDYGQLGGADQLCKLRAIFSWRIGRFPRDNFTIFMRFAIIRINNIFFPLYFFRKFKFVLYSNWSRCFVNGEVVSKSKVDHSSKLF